MSGPGAGNNNVCVIGSGAWGTALAQAASMAGNDVVLIGRDARLAQEISLSHTNTKYLKNQKLSPRIYATTDLGALEQASLVLLALPAQTTRQVIKTIAAGLKPKLPVVVTAKGFEQRTLARQSQIVHEHWPQAQALVLSGPSFAVDVAAGRPTAVTLAGHDLALVERVALRLASDSFRPYVCGDPLGVELAGGLKNVYALACGAVEGAGLGLSARSALIARAHAEMTRVIKALGGQEQTMGGLAGLGDLALSCTSTRSRNYLFGVELGRGKTVEEVRGAGLGLAEGVATAPVALELAGRAGLEVVLIKAVNQLLFDGAKISDIVRRLMRRPLKNEG